MGSNKDPVQAKAKMNYELKKHLTAIYTTCDTLDECNLGVQALGGIISTKDALKLELTRFLCYLSISDGNITPNQCFLLNEYFDWNLTLSDIEQFTKEDSLETHDFKRNGSLICNVFTHADNTIFQATGHIETSAAQHLLTLYELFGKEALSVLDKITANQIHRFTSYIEDMKTYIEEHFVF